MFKIEVKTDFNADKFRRTIMSNLAEKIIQRIAPGRESEISYAYTDGKLEFHGPAELISKAADALKKEAP